MVTFYRWLLVKTKYFLAKDPDARIFLRQLQVQSWFSREWFLFYSHVNKDGLHSLLLPWGSSSPLHDLGWCYLNELGLSPIMKQSHKTWHLTNIPLLSQQWVILWTGFWDIHCIQKEVKCLGCCIENVWASRRDGMKSPAKIL